MIIALLEIVHVFVCLFLMLVVLLQQGKGGGMGAAFGGGATQQVFGGRGAGNILTRATAVCAATFMLTSVTLAYVASAGDRDLKAHIVEEQRKGKGHEGTRVKTSKPKAAGMAPDNAPAVPAPPPETPPSPPAPASAP
jgi:preprotein translocase subunit SecG